MPGLARGARPRSFLSHPRASDSHPRGGGGFQAQERVHRTLAHANKLKRNEGRESGMRMRGQEVRAVGKEEGEVPSEPGPSRPSTALARVAMALGSWCVPGQAGQSTSALPPPPHLSRCACSGGGHSLPSRSNRSRPGSCGSDGRRGAPLQGVLGTHRCLGQRGARQVVRGKPWPQWLTKEEAWYRAKHYSLGVKRHKSHLF